MNKWRKWQLGGGATLLLALGFTAVRNDPAFAQAHQMALATGGGANPQTGLGQTGRDRIFDDYQQQQPGIRGRGDDGGGGSRMRGGRGRGNDDFGGGNAYGGGGYSYGGGGSLAPGNGGGNMSPYAISPRTRSGRS